MLLPPLRFDIKVVKARISELRSGPSDASAAVTCGRSCFYQRSDQTIDMQLDTAVWFEMLRGRFAVDPDAPLVALAVGLNTPFNLLL